jgi:two-component system nitrogen regulation response regulator GlnG
VDTAADGLAGLAMVQAQPYDVALLDYRMPGMTGLELYGRIKQLRPGTVAVLVSAYTDPVTRDAALGAGVWKVLVKPVDLPRSRSRGVNFRASSPVIRASAPIRDSPRGCAR